MHFLLFSDGGRGGGRGDGRDGRGVGVELVM